LDDPRRTATEWLERPAWIASATAWSANSRAACASAWPSRAASCINRRCCLLDEPFTALDDRAIQVLQDLLKSALAEGRTIIMSTHQLREALELATDVALINRGKLAFRGARTWEMLEDPGWLYRHYGEA
jgi:ABC-type cobalamin transport system ATPase subunit